MIAIVDVDLGNVASIKNMLDYLGIESFITSQVNDLKKASKIILPGVGSFDSGIKNLKKYSFFEAIKEDVKKNKPLLGICLGMQLLGQSSEEGIESGLDLLPANVVKFKFNDKTIKIPHMGWNYLKEINSTSPIMSGINKSDRFYFVHSYHLIPKDKDIVIAKSNYSVDFCASLEYKNVFGVQFHPEKSHHYGMKILSNFGAIDVSV